jgi:hypothetical protein
VVGVAMGQDHAADVVERPAHERELRLEVVPMAGQASVDDGDPRRNPRPGSC